MSQTSLLESNQGATEHKLNPKLKAVLASLDVQIEDELTRYRRYRRRTQPQGQGLSKTKMGGNTQTQNLEMQSGANTREEIKSELPEAEKLGESKSPESSTPERSPIFIAPSSPGSLTIGKTELQEETAATESPKGLNDYLESSERLVKSLEGPTQAKPKQRSLAASLFTPLGIASMLLFMLSCTVLGSAFIYGKNQNYLGLGDLLDGKTPSGEAENAENVETASEGETGAGELPKSPLSRQQDFVELDLETLGTVNPNPVSIPSLSLTPSIPPPISGTIRVPSGSNPGANSGGLNDLGTSLLPQTAQPNGSQPQLNVPPQRPVAPPKPAAPAKVQTPIESADGWFYVVQEYAGENSLAQAREAVPDAYIRQTTDGPKIQMGALLDAESAKQLLKELEEQGISAEFYKF